MYWASITFLKDTKEQSTISQFYGSLISVMARVEEIQKNNKLISVEIKYFDE